VMSRLISASTFSSGGSVFVCFPSSSEMQDCRMRSPIILLLYSSPMRRMLPMVRSFTLRSAASRSYTSVMVSSAERASAAPSNSSCRGGAVSNDECRRRRAAASPHLAGVQQHPAEGERLVLALQRRELWQSLGQAHAHRGVQRAKRRLPDGLRVRR
jgi:hypothetical protein